MNNNDFIQQLNEYFTKYLPDIKCAKTNTISSYADSFVVFFEFLYTEKQIDHTKLKYSDFSQQLFDEYILWLRNTRHYADSSLSPRIAALVSFFRYASRRNITALCAYASVTATEIPKVHRTEFPYFNTDEIAIILKLPDPQKYLGSRDLVLLSFLYETAARAQEVCDVCVKDIRFGSPTKVKLIGKGGKAREIPISNEVTALLQYHLRQQGCCSSADKERPLFLSQSNDKMTTACVRSIVMKYVKQAKEKHPELFKQKNYSPHSFRHSKAVHMAEAGIPLIYIRNFLGHAFTNTTEIYARVGQAAVTKALTERIIPTTSAAVPQKKTVGCPIPNFIKSNR